MGKFNRLERPEDRARTKSRDPREERAAASRPPWSAPAEYREAYAALAATNPDVASRFPHPDSVSSDVDTAAAALEAIRRLPAGFRAVPPGRLRG